LVIDGVSRVEEVVEDTVEEVSEFLDVRNVEGLSSLGLDELGVNGENLVGVAGSDGDGEEGVDHLDESNWDDTGGFEFELVEDVLGFSDLGDGVVDGFSSLVVEGDLTSSGDSEVVELLAVNVQGLAGEISEVSSSGLFTLGEVELGLASVKRVSGGIDFRLSEVEFFSAFFSLFGVEVQVVFVLLEDLVVEVVEEANELVVLLEGVGLEEVDEVSEGNSLLLLEGFNRSNISLEGLGFLVDSH